MRKNHNLKQDSQYALLALLAVGLICIVIFLSMRLITLTEDKKVPVEELLQQYWLDHYAASTTSAQKENAIEAAWTAESSKQDQPIEQGVEDQKKQPSEQALVGKQGQSMSDTINPDQKLIDESTEADMLAADTSKIDINTANAAQLQQLKGIGPSKAQAIVDDREQKGKFKRIEDIKRVKGIGEKLYAGIQESIVANQ